VQSWRESERTERSEFIDYIQYLIFFWSYSTEKAFTKYNIEIEIPGITIFKKQLAD